MIYTYSVLNTVQAAHADIIGPTGRLMSITGTPQWNYIELKGFTETVSAAEVDQVSTVTIPDAGGGNTSNNTTFEFSLIQTVDNGVILRDVVTYISDSNATQAEAMAAFSKIIIAKGFKITPTSVGNVLTLTAQAGFPIFSITAVMNVIVNTTLAGSFAVGTYDAARALVKSFNATNTQPAVDFTSGKTYKMYQFVFEVEVTPEFGTDDRSTDQTHFLFVNDDNTTGFFATFNTSLENIMHGGTAASATTANPEAFGLI